MLILKMAQQMNGSNMKRKQLESVHLAHNTDCVALQSFKTDTPSSAAYPAVMGKFDAFQQKMQDAGLNQAAIDAFRLNYEQLEQGVTGLVRHHIASCACGDIPCAALHRRCARGVMKPSALQMNTGTCSTKPSLH